MTAIFRAGWLVTLLLALSACNGSGGGGGGGSTIPNDNSACPGSNCAPENEPPDNQNPLVCDGIQGAVCPDGYHCVDDSSDDCDPATGADCGGICVLGTDRAGCGGFAGVACDQGYVCVDDPNDDCPGGPAVDCPGVCTPEDPTRECSTEMECPQLDALCSYCADGNISCPITKCDDGKCVIAVDACPPAPRCGGIAGFGCDAGLECVDDPSDLCDPRSGDADCFGVCVPQVQPPSCGGIDGMGCPPGSACIDDPNDDCRPDASGADCPGICEAPNGECRTNADCPQLRAPCSVCPDGTTACPSSTCDNGVCNVSFPTCKPAVICGDDAQPCKPEHVCVDDPADACDPSNGEVGCPGQCVPREIPRSCGGSAGDTCPPGFECFYDTPDGCVPDPTGMECGGICRPINSSECETDDQCPHLPVPCMPCRDGSLACPVGFCGNGKCQVAVQSCPDPMPDPGFCGGIAGFPCPPGLTCIDNPNDECDPATGGADCGGICVREEKPLTCGGIAGFPCPPGLTCIDNPNDECDPANGGADCGGICVREEKPLTCGGFAGDSCPEGYECVDQAGDDCDPDNGGADCPAICRPSQPPMCSSDEECPVIGAPCMLCADGTAACPRSSCVNGQCFAIFESCRGEES